MHQWPTGQPQTADRSRMNNNPKSGVEFVFERYLVDNEIRALGVNQAHYGPWYKGHRGGSYFDILFRLCDHKFGLYSLVGPQKSKLHFQSVPLVRVENTCLVYYVP